MLQSNDIAEKEILPVKALLLVAFFQGATLLLLHRIFENEWWPYDKPEWMTVLYACTIFIPTMVLLGLNDKNAKKLVPALLVFAVILALLGYYTGYQANPVAKIRIHTGFWVFVVGVKIAAFKWLLYSQQFSEGGSLSYSRLFRQSWRNFMTLALALLFTLIFWSLLGLWALLFEAINIEFFSKLFRKDWFLYPVLGLAHGVGIVIFRQLSTVIDTITRLQQALMKFLLVFLIFISMIFLVALLVTGLDPLWKTGGSTLLLTLQGILLFFLNAVYQDDPETIPYPVLVHRFIYVGVALLPIYSAIIFYGLSLRIEQHGWTVLRLSAALCWVFFVLFSGGYLFGILKLRDQWLWVLGWVNVRMGMLVLLSMIVINSPLLDFRKLSVKSQLTALENGDVSLADFDFQYLRRALARPGYQALQDLKLKYAETRPDISAQIDKLYTSYDGLGDDSTPPSQDDLLAAITLINTTIPDPLKEPIYDYLLDKSAYFGIVTDRYFYKVQLDNNDEFEYVLFTQQQWGLVATLFYWQEGVWLNTEMNNTKHLNSEDKEMAVSALLSGAVLAKSPRWKNIEFGGAVFEAR